MDYLGPHDPVIANLYEFVRGEIYKSSGEPRKSYMGQTVIDMSLIRMHFARNEISDRSFSCLDYTFFKDDASKAEQFNPHGQEEEKKEPASSGDDKA